jgi:hypothetical protein
MLMTSQLKSACIQEKNEISAGLTRMRYARFLLFEIIAALLWNTLYSLIGYFAAVEIDLLQLFFERAGWIILGIPGILFVGWQIWKRRARQKRRSKRFLQRVKQHKMLQGEQCVILTHRHTDMHQQKGIGEIYESTHPRCGR